MHTLFWCLLSFVNCVKYDCMHICLPHKSDFYFDFPLLFMGELT